MKTWCQSRRTTSFRTAATKSDAGSSFGPVRRAVLWSVMVTYRDQHQPSHLEAGVAQDLTRSTVKKEGHQMLPKPKLGKNNKQASDNTPQTSSPTKDDDHG